MNKRYDERRNMYECLPCPKCKSEYRWPDQKGNQQCDDCGHVEPWDAYLRERLAEKYPA